MFVASWLCGIPLESPHTSRYAVQPQQFLGQPGKYLVQRLYWMCIVYTVVDGGHVFGTWSFMSLGFRGEDGRLGPFSLRVTRQILSFTTLIMNQLRLRESWSLRVLETTQQNDARTDD